MLDRGLAAELTMVALFAVALVVSLLVPELAYYPLFVLALTGPLSALLFRSTHRRS
ncbi:hypothetical protein ACIQLJ_12840 [Microbacterium sp. NPDC091313]